MSEHALIVIGTSAGGIRALIKLVGGLPKDLNAPICIALHAEPGRPGELLDILNRQRTLIASHPHSSIRLIPGHLFLAPTDYQLLIEGEQVIAVYALSQRPRNDIDLMFQSAATSYGPRVIAVILTGRLTDGTRGMQVVKERGGITIIQDPDDAAFPSMPRSAQAHCAIDYCLPLVQIAPLLQQLVESAASIST